MKGIIINYLSVIDSELDNEKDKRPYAHACTYPHDTQVLT